MVIEFKGKALGLVSGVIRDHELTWPQAYLWYVLGYSRDAMGEDSHVVDTAGYAGARLHSSLYQAFPPGLAGQGVGGEGSGWELRGSSLQAPVIGGSKLWG